MKELIETIKGLADDRYVFTTGEFGIAAPDLCMVQDLKALVAQFEAMTEALETANTVRYPLSDDGHYWTGITRYMGNPNQPYFGKWMAANGEYEHETALDAFLALRDAEPRFRTGIALGER